jgi:hypothetical protein
LGQGPRTSGKAAAKATGLTRFSGGRAMTTRDDLLDLMDGATLFCDMLDRGDAAHLADAIIDKLIDALRRDQRFSKLTRDAWELLLADVRKVAEDEITALVKNHVEYSDVTGSIADELLSEEIRVIVNSSPADSVEEEAGHE